MKRMGLMVVLMLATVALSAQSYAEKRNHLGMEIGVGGAGCITADIGLKWQMDLHDYLAWDVISLKVISAVEEDVFKTMTPQLMTGPRFYTPRIKNSRFYVNGRAGYAHNFDLEDGGFTYELGAGLELSKKVSIGYAYNHYEFEENLKYTVNYHAFRISFLF